MVAEKGRVAVELKKSGLYRAVGVVAPLLDVKMLLRSPVARDIKIIYTALLEGL